MKSLKVKKIQGKTFTAKTLERELRHIAQHAFRERFGVNITQKNIKLLEGDWEAEKMMDEKVSFADTSVMVQIGTEVYDVTARLCGHMGMYTIVKSAVCMCER